MIAGLLQMKDARRVYRAAINSGALVPEPCVVCGRENVDGHHEDYSKPLDVIWLCRMHHRWRHCYGTEVEGMVAWQLLSPTESAEVAEWIEARA